MYPACKFYLPMTCCQDMFDATFKYWKWHNLRTVCAIDNFSSFFIIFKALSDKKIKSDIFWRCEFPFNNNNICNHQITGMIYTIQHNTQYILPTATWILHTTHYRLNTIHYTRYHGLLGYHGKYCGGWLIVTLLKKRKADMKLWCFRCRKMYLGYYSKGKKNQKKFGEIIHVTSKNIKTSLHQIHLTCTYIL